MSNKYKIDISQSKRPNTTNIKVVDEYSNERTFPITGELHLTICLLYTSPSPRDVEEARMPSSA